MPSSTTLTSVATLCRRLDGIPLALELAAARMRAFSAAQIMEQLDSGWSVSAARRDQGPARHISLDDTIEWSYRLLDDGERDLLLVLGTFRGQFDLAAAAAVAGCDTMTTADRLAQLVEKSLLQTAAGPAGRRFRLLETVRAFLAARIDARRRGRWRAIGTPSTSPGRSTSSVRSCPGPTRTMRSARLAVEFDDVHAAYEHAAAARGRGHRGSPHCRAATRSVDRERALGASRAAGRGAPRDRGAPRVRLPARERGVGRGARR